LQWYLNQVELQEEQSLGLIIKLVEANRGWSEFVQSAWQGQVNQVRFRILRDVDFALNICCFKAYRYTCDQHDDVWRVYSKAADGQNIVHIVKQGVVGKSTPSCDPCSYFSSCRMPCRHICAVSIACKKDPINVRSWNKVVYSHHFPQIDILAQRWRIAPHPLMSIALERMGLSPSPMADFDLVVVRILFKAISSTCIIK
jgi:hypothetical protein